MIKEERQSFGGGIAGGGLGVLFLLWAHMWGRGFPLVGNAKQHHHLRGVEPPANTSAKTTQLMLLWSGVGDKGWTQHHQISKVRGEMDTQGLKCSCHS